MLGRRIAARQPPPTCLPELRRALLDEWCNIPQDQIDNLILSMPRRCLFCSHSSLVVVLTSSLSKSHEFEPKHHSKSAVERRCVNVNLSAHVKPFVALSHPFGMV
ncbi:transposable element Tcb1 transposase [Trichonephila clavipes]|nr:transposable element Tcb1 transposase [Trichonephila clavipes]